MLLNQKTKTDTAKAVIEALVDDSRMKSIFDHIRNLGISIGFIGMGKWLTSQSNDWFLNLTGYMTIASGVVLGLLNLIHAIVKLQKDHWTRLSTTLFSIAYAVIVACALLFTVYGKK